MNYPIVIHKDKASDYGVTVPDLPGCFSAGSTIDEAIASAREAVELHLEGMIEAGQPIPRAGRIEDHAANAEYRNGIWAVVFVDPSSLRTRAKRVNITLPERVLDAIDGYTQKHGGTRSEFLLSAAVTYIGDENKALRPAKRGRRRSPKLAKGR